LIQTGAYVLIVSFIFGSRLEAECGSLDYALYVLGGTVPWTIMTKTLSEAPGQIRDRMELVKQVIYPIETLPMTSLLMGSFGAGISLLIFLVLTAINGSLHWSILLLPLPIFLLMLLLLGISWMFSIIAIFFKDLREIITILLGLLVYISPVVSVPTLAGNQVWNIILLNPLSHVVISFRDLYYQEFHFLSWIIFITMSLTTFRLGAFVIARTKLIINQYI